MNKINYMSNILKKTTTNFVNFDTFCSIIHSEHIYGEISKLNISNLINISDLR